MKPKLNEAVRMADWYPSRQSIISSVLAARSIDASSLKAFEMKELLRLSSKHLSVQRRKAGKIILAGLSQAEPSFPTIFADLKLLMNPNLFSGCSEHEAKVACLAFLKKMRSSGGYDNAFSTIRASLETFRKVAANFGAAPIIDYILEQSRLPNQQRSIHVFFYSCHLYIILFRILLLSLMLNVMDLMAKTLGKAKRNLAKR